jgi:capsule biosynthesis phosphatase
MRDLKIDGIIPCASVEGGAWSFCEVDNQDRVVRVREKERISPWGSVGLYFFRLAGEFFSKAKAFLAADETTKGEYYVAPLYGKYILEGKRIVIDRVSLFKPMGTPEQVTKYWNTSIEAMQIQNIAPVVVIDLDNTITIEEPGTAYEEKKPNVPVIQKMKELASSGVSLIIYSSRRMETFRSNEAKVVADIADTTLQWLKKYQVPFDGLRFGKPFAKNGFYFDDKALRPDEFVHMPISAFFKVK